MTHDFRTSSSFPIRRLGNMLGRSKNTYLYIPWTRSKDQKYVYTRKLQGLESFIMMNISMFKNALLFLSRGIIICFYTLLFEPVNRPQSKLLFITVPVAHLLSCMRNFASFTR
ncbi:hypothetical protein V8F06_014219 [Rhypophila decipiens]